MEGQRKMATAITKIVFDYKKPKANTTERRTLSHVQFGKSDEGVPYVSGYCAERRSIRTFRLDRISWPNQNEETDE